MLIIIIHISCSSSVFAWLLWIADEKEMQFPSEWELNDYTTIFQMSTETC